MSYQEFFGLLRAKIGTLILIGLLGAALGFFLLMLTEKRFQSSTDFLVVQVNQSQDFYTQFKSSEYLGKILSEAVFSERFIDAVIATGKVNPEFLPFDKKERLDRWSQMIEVRKNLELGMLGVTVKSDKERDASRVMEGIAQVLTKQNMLFRGGDEKSVDIRVLSGPIIEKSPTVAKLVQVTGGAFAAAFLLSAFFVLVTHETKRKEHDVERANQGLREMALNDLPA